MRAVAITACSLVLAGCMLGPDYQRPEVPSTDDWHMNLQQKQLQGPSLAEQQWLDLFQDEQLQSVVQQALQSNRSLLQALERIEESRALYRVGRAPLFPSLDLELAAEREQESGLTSSDPVLDDELFFGASASWELDLWGKNRRAGRAAYARYLASEYGAQAVRLSLIADTCQAYFRLQGVNARLATNYDTLSARGQSREIADKRFRGGLTSSLEVKQAEVELASARAAIPEVEQQKLVAENELSLLMGLPPQHIEVRGELEQQPVPATVTAGLPSSLLQRRPDLIEAEQTLIAASEEVGVATARLFPSIALTGQFGTESAALGDLLDSDGRYWIVELDILMPLFNAGARKAELSAAESRFNQARLAYEQAVLEALREASNALNQFYKAGESLQAQLSLEKASSEYLALASKRYRNGVLAYLDVLDAQRLLFDAQLAVSNAREAQLFALVDLYKALGGGWDPAAVSTPAR